MAIQTFTAGQVLTAAQMTSLQANDYNQTVSTKTASYTLVAADKGTRVVMNSASATTITVNTSLFSANDTLILQNIGAGVCTVTAGTATVSSAGPLAIPQNGSGTLYFTSAGVSIYYPSAVTASAAGLTLISTTTIGTTVTSVALTNVFSATYDNYRIVLSGGTASATSDGSFILGATTSGYYTGFSYQAIGGGGSFTSTGVINGASSSTNFAYSSNGINGMIDLYQPFLTSRTNFFFTAQTMATAGNRWQGGGFQDSATSFTGITFSTQSGHTLTGGTIKVYGLANS